METSEKLKALTATLRGEPPAEVPPVATASPTPDPLPTADILPDNEFEETDEERSAANARIIECALKLRKHRLSFNVIGQHVGVSHTTVMRWCQGHGVKPLRNPTVQRQSVDDILQELATLLPYRAGMFTAGTARTPREAQDAVAELREQLAATNEQRAATITAMKAIGSANIELRNRINKLEEDFYAEPDGSD